MDIMQHIDLISALAQKATRGEWREVEDKYDFTSHITTTSRFLRGKIGIANVDTIDDDPANDFAQEQKANAEYIAAMYPDLALAMCDEIKRLREENAQLKADFDAADESDKAVKCRAVLHWLLANAVIDDCPFEASGQWHKRPEYCNMADGDGCKECGGGQHAECWMLYAQREIDKGQGNGND